MAHESAQLSRKVMSAEDVVNFVQQAMFKHNITNVKDATIDCIDGRPDQGPTDTTPVLLKPGGSAGCLMTAFATCNNLELLGQSNDRVYNAFLQGTDGPTKFTFHTDDTHAEPGTGCGHLNKSREDFTAYDLKKEQIEFIFGKLPEVLEQGGKQVVKSGDHEEQAILLIESDTYAVRTFLPDANGGGTQAFVYNQYLDAYRQEDIGKALYAEFFPQNPQYNQQAYIQGVKAVTTKQLMATKDRIAKGIPVFVVRINNAGNITVTTQ